MIAYPIRKRQVSFQGEWRGQDSNAILNQFYAVLILALLLAYLRTLTSKSPPLSPLCLSRKLRDKLFLPINAEYLLLSFLSIERSPPPLKHPTVQLPLALTFPG